MLRRSVRLAGSVFSAVTDVAASPGRLAHDLPGSHLLPRLVVYGAAFAVRPSSGNLLSMLGRDEPAQVDALTELLRDSSPAELEQLFSVFSQSVERLSRQPGDVGRR